MNTPSLLPIVGRFAPSPTGSLHFGSVVAALASYCMAKRHHGRWLVRMDDLDQPRVIAGAADTILRQLEALGLHWDDTIIFQSQRTDRYIEVLNHLDGKGLLYPCQCSRKEILASAPHIGEEGPIYPGTCLNRPPQPGSQVAFRLKTAAGSITFKDLIQGQVEQHLAREVGDFTLRRSDGIFAYQLATVIDDHDSGVTQVVRGRDLLSSTPRQVYLHQQLGFALPMYAHVPLALSCHGEKISKRHHQVCFSPTETPQHLLWQAFCFLGQPLPAELAKEPTSTLLEFGCHQFDIKRVPQFDHCIPESSV